MLKVEEVVMTTRQPFFALMHTYTRVCVGFWALTHKLARIHEVGALDKKVTNGNRAIILLVKSNGKLEYRKVIKCV